VNAERNTASLFGWLFIATFVLSIPAYFIFYAPVSDEPGFITGAGADESFIVGLGALSETLLIIANVGTATVLYRIIRRQSEAGALSYVAARIMESVFIGIGVIAMLTLLFLREESPAIGDAAFGQLLLGVYDRAFLLGPGFFAGLANGVILGWLMYRTGLVPRGMAMLGLVGGPLLLLSAAAIMLGLAERGGTLQGIATIPEFFWELSLGIYCVVKGFRSSPILEPSAATT
jgi:Domain of unknown function (DUF4386)